MKENEVLKILKSLGVRVVNGSNHYKLFYKEKWTTMLRHPSKEFRNNNLRKILKQLKIDHRF